MARVLVTGAAGFVGSHLLELLAQDGADLVAWQRPGTEPLVAGNGVRWTTVEMLDRDAVRAALHSLQPEMIYHLAGLPHVGDSWGKTRDTFEGNVLASHYLFDGLRREGLKPRVLVSSTAFVYKPVERALVESDEVCPNSPYGTSKLAQEMVAVRAWLDDGIPGLIARAFNHVGPRQSPTFVAPSIARQIAAIEAGRAEPVLKMGNLETRRDLMDVRDTVKAYRAMMVSGATPGVPYNVSSGSSVVIKDLVGLFIARAKIPIGVEQDPAKFRPVDTAFLQGDHSRVTADTGWAPQIPLERTVDDLLTYWRSQP
ncbi:MAG: GDP-mannose 4,6-dehydratase [Vicinamibacterales bacterium]